MESQKLVISHPNKKEIPLIKDVGIAAIKDLIRNAKKVSKDVQKLRTSFNGMEDKIHKLDIPLHEVSKDLKDLKVSLEEVT